MRILTINCGSSSLKFDLFELPAGTQGGGSPARIASGAIERVGGESVASLRVGEAPAQRRRRPLSDHAAAMEEAFRLLRQRGLLQGLDAAGHRVVHGGPELQRATLIDATALLSIRRASEQAPLHNAPALAAIEAARAALGPDLPMVASFDTSFFASLPPVARTYALPRDLNQRLGIRRYGFHGLAHRHMVARFRQLCPDVASPRLVTFQLGNGCSMTASRDGVALDTSMGFTPLEGLVMGSRSGDLDPALPLYIAEREGLSPEDVEALLNRRSGLLGLAGRSDMRDLLAAARAGDEGARLAIDLFCYRARKYLGAYLAVLGGCDGIVFGGGIGENSAEVRRGICGGMAWAGIELDEGRNAAAGPEALISREGSAVQVWVVAVDEAVEIARDTAACLAGREPSGKVGDEL